MATTGERVGKNEALFREVNERIKEVSATHFGFDASDQTEFVCECSSEECHKAVAMSRLEYEEVRADPTHFLVSPGHLWLDEVERAVARHERYWVVQKESDAARVAADEDPRN